MKTNDLKKGTRIGLRNGWEAELMNSMKGNTREAKVFGSVIEIGSVYAHDIVAYKDADGNWKTDIEYTPAQIKCKEMVKKLFGG